MSKRLSGPRRIFRGILFIAGGIVVALPVLALGLWEIVGLVLRIVRAPDSHGVFYALGYHGPIILVICAFGILVHWMISTGIDYLRAPVFGPDGQSLGQQEQD